MRLAYLASPRTGSRYKYHAMFSRVADVSVTDDPSGFDGAVVFGDRGTEWRRCVDARVPFVLVENDVATLRVPKLDDTNEREMHLHARAVLYPSEAMRDYCLSRYRVRHAEVVHLRPLARDLDFTPREKQPRTLVYAGGIRDTGGGRGRGYGYRLYHGIFASAIAAGWRVVVLPSTPVKALAGYTALGVEFMPHVPARDLYAALSAYAVGLQAYACDGYGMRFCLPNKTWEYLAAGIPTLGVGAGLAASIYHGRWGLAGGVDDMAENLAALEDMTVPGNVRRQQVIDEDVSAFERLVGTL